MKSSQNIGGTAVHSGGFRFDEGESDLEEILAIIAHIHDILLRIFFKIINYEGKYCTSILRSPVSKSIDWVKENMKPGDLGYKIEIELRNVI